MPKYVFFMLFILVVSACKTVNKPVGNVGERIAQTSVRIFNNSSSPKTIFLGPTTSNIKPYLIREQQSWISPSLSYNPIFIMGSEGAKVTYSLSLGESYQIYWNTTKNLWDVKKYKDPDGIPFP